MGAVNLDNDVKNKLDLIKSELRKQGINGPSYSDTIRFLYDKYKQKEGEQNE